MNLGKLKSIILFAALTHVQCGQSGGKSDLSEITYRLARTATNATNNTLYINLSKTEGFSFMIEGTGFSASVAFDKRLPIQESVQLSYKLVGTYQLNLKIFYQDGSILINERLTWRFNTDPPEKPNITFSEEATNDQDVLLVIDPDDIDEDTQELWVEGDVISGNKGWHTISDDFTVPIKVTRADGMKYLTVKYRNVFGSVGDSQELEILKKSIGPSNCITTINTLVTGTGVVTFYLSAVNDGDLYYLISGDIGGSKGKWTKFSTSSISKDVAIIDTTATNNITVQLRDIASNFCPDKKFAVTYDAAHESTRILIDGSTLWTDDPQITALPQLDYIPSDTVLMYIHGNVLASADTFAWIPYKTTVDVELTPTDGNRFVRVQYRINGVDSAIKSVAVYLKPFIKVASAGPAPYTLSLSEIVGLQSLTVTGCDEIYNQVAPTSSVSCTPTVGSATVTYHLSDGTSVSKTTSVP